MAKALALLLLTAAAAADSPTLEAIWEKAQSKSWRARRAAVEQLARRPLGDEVFQVRLLLRTDPRPEVREVIAWAAVLEPRLVNATLLGLALSLAACGGVMQFSDKAAIENVESMFF